MAASPSIPELVVVVNNRGTRDGNQRTYKHTCHYLTVLLRGKGAYRNNEMDLPADRPLWGFLPRGDVDVDGLQGPFESWYAGFHWPGMQMKAAGVAEVDLQWNGRAMRVPRCKRIDASSVANVVETYRAMRDALQRQDLSGQMLASALLMKQFSAYIDLPGGTDAPPSHRALARFHDLLNERACAEDSIEQLAEAAGATADHLRELFRERFGKRPVEYRTGLKLARARELLASTTMNVKEVAHKAGFPDPMYFSRVFRRQFGISPREMIRMFRMMR